MMHLKVPCLILSVLYPSKSPHFFFFKKKRIGYCCMVCPLCHLLLNHWPPSHPPRPVPLGSNLLLEVPSPLLGSNLRLKMLPPPLLTTPLGPALVIIESIIAQVNYCNFVPKLGTAKTSDITKIWTFQPELFTNNIWAVRVFTGSDLITGSGPKLAILLIFKTFFLLLLCL